MHDPLDAETQAFLLEPTRLQQFRDQLRSAQRRTVRQDVVWRAFVASYRDLPSGPERRHWLMAVLENLSQRGDIELPVRHGKQWDRTSEIALPKAVTVVPQHGETAGNSDWRNQPWHPRLQWIFDLRVLTKEQVSFLQRVNQGLVEGWFEEPECFKYRSLQLTGDEKRLESLLKGTLFSPGHLTLELLGCEADSLPLATDRVSTQPTMLVFENAAPFMLARRILAKATQTDVGRLAYGAGKQVLKAVSYLTMIDPPIEQILYIGDLDAAGLMIAAEFQRLSKTVVVRPADQFHRAMLESAAELGSPDGWPVKDEQPLDVSESALSFLAPDVRRRVKSIVASGRRVPEEVLSHRIMCRLLQVV